MNPWQMAQQIKHELQTVTWADGSQAVVFGSRHVFVYAGDLDGNALDAGTPLALVVIGGGSADENDPEMIDASFAVACLADVTGDHMGELAVTGGSIADWGKSEGRGVAEVAERARSAVQYLTGYDGAKIILQASATSAHRVEGENRHVAVDEFTLSALCTSQPHYAPPQQLELTGDTWTWQGVHCTSRFDFLEFALAYKTGSTPPATYADADGVIATTTDLELTHTSVGGRAYSIFACYDPRGTTSATHYSPGDRVGAYLTT